MREFWDLPYWQRFVFGAGRRLEQWRFGNWRVAVGFFGLLGVLMIWAAVYFWAAALLSAAVLILAWVSWHYGRHMKGRVTR